MRANSAGFSFVEMLAAVALVGLLAMTGVGLVTSLAHSADEDGLAGSGSHRRILALRRLRADAAQSSTATIHAGRLQLSPTEASDVTSRWCVRNGRLFELREDGGETCDASAIRVRKLAHANVIELDLAAYGRVMVLVGGGAP